MSGAISASIRPAAAIRGAISFLGSQLQARTVALGGPKSLEDLSDVNLENVSDGSVLIFDGATQKFVATNSIENPNTRIIGGSF